MEQKSISTRQSMKLSGYYLRQCDVTLFTKEVYQWMHHRYKVSSLKGIFNARPVASHRGKLLERSRPYHAFPWKSSRIPSSLYIIVGERRILLLLPVLSNSFLHPIQTCFCFFAKLFFLSPPSASSPVYLYANPCCGYLSYA